MASPRLKALPPPAAVPHSSAPTNTGTRGTDSYSGTNPHTRRTDSCSGTNTRARRTGPRDRANAWCDCRPRNDNGCARNYRRAGNTDADTWHHTRSRRAHSHAGSNTGTRCSHTRAAGHASTRRTGASSHTAARLSGFGRSTDDRSDKGHGDGEIL